MRPAGAASPAGQGPSRGVPRRYDPGGMGCDQGELLEVRGLTVAFDTAAGPIRPVDGVSLSVRRGETVAIVGESGCGKSLTALAILRLIDPPGRIAGGQIAFEGTDLLSLPQRRMRRLQGGRIAMIFQEPLTSLNPVLTAGRQIVEAIELHCGLGGRSARELAVRLLAEVGIGDASRRLRAYPHELSGGMCQRVMIAMALAGRPSLLIADEPTTALDATIQAQVLELLADIQRRTGMSLLLITHDLGVAARMADRVNVMYAGRVVESGVTAALLDEPLHPYTQALLRCLPRLPRTSERLEVIPGLVPSPGAFPAGCRFHPRCAVGREDPRCQTEDQPLLDVRPARRAACWKALAASRVESSSGW